MEFDFSFPEFDDISFLHGDDLKFFYYDICENNLVGFPSDAWDKACEEFKGVMDVKVKDKEEINTDKNLVDNRIIFSTDRNETELDAFFRHLRNAFSHHHVCKSEDNFIIIDRNDKAKDENKRITMRGKVNDSLLKNFCFRLMDFRKELEDEYNNSLNYNV